MRMRGFIAICGTLGGLATAVLLGSCLSPTSIDCPNGVVCPAGKHWAKSQHTCVNGTCGDGTVDPSEVCDDGNILDGDGCSADCKSKETCGNGVKDVKFTDKSLNETCDDG